MTALSAYYIVVIATLFVTGADRSYHSSWLARVATAGLVAAPLLFAAGHPRAASLVYMIAVVAFVIHAVREIVDSIRSGRTYIRFSSRKAS